jgi:electron transfer flavoprotein-quinone oxidoreductase
MEDDLFDVIIVGAGFAGCAAAYKLANAGCSVLVVERGNYPGAKNMTGGRMYAHALDHLMPDWQNRNPPIQRKITHEKISFLTKETNFAIDVSSVKLGGETCHSFSILPALFDQWFAEQAEGAGAEFINGIRVDDLIVRNGKVCGVRAGEDELESKLVILCDGVNSLLAQKLGMLTELEPHEVAVGLKELIELDEKTVSDRFGCADGEGTAWLFIGEATAGRIGGGFLYTNRNSVSLGLVATMSDVVKGDVPVYQMLDDFKQHPSIAPLIADGKTIEYSGHAVSEGGYYSIPKIAGDGVLVAGDAAMFCMNIGYQVRGFDFACASGEMAADAAIECLKKGDLSKTALGVYRQKVEQSFIVQDLKAFRSFPEFMLKTTRLFETYPTMVEELMMGVFAVDGQPLQPLLKRLMPPIKKAGRLKLLKDAIGGVRAL